MDTLRIGLKAATKRITYGEKNPAIYAVAIACFLVATFGFDLLVPRFSSLPRAGIYVAGFFLGMGSYRLVMKVLGTSTR